jgi:RNA polymerase sigma-70 factor, ECF subfamily
MSVDVDEPDTEQLLNQVAGGNDEALQRLLRRHRKRLRHMIELRLDARLAARIDASDVIQETLLEATRQLAHYLENRPLPFYPWLRQIGMKRLSRLCERHFTAQRRSVYREQARDLPVSEHGLRSLAERFVCRGPSPSGIVASREQRQRVHVALAQLANNDRDLLVMRFLEHLSLPEIAAVFGISEGAMRVRQVRALQRLQRFLGDQLDE